MFFICFVNGIYFLVVEGVVVVGFEGIDFFLVVLGFLGVVLFLLVSLMLVVVKNLLFR